MILKGKTALITGAATGIGRAVAILMAKEGANVIVNYSRSKEEALDTKSEVENHKARCLVIRSDVSKNDQVKQMIDKAVEHFGSIDVLINNAGTTNFVALNDLDSLTEEYWDRAFSVNVKGMFNVSRACAGELRKNRGCIVNITSIAGFNGAGSSIAYAASKAAGISLTKSFARVLAPEVRVNSIAPGIVNTRWVDGHDEHVQLYSEETPLDRVAEPEDIANMTVALIKGGDFVTGQTLIVDGGWSL